MSAQGRPWGHSKCGMMTTVDLLCSGEFTLLDRALALKVRYPNSSNAKIAQLLHVPPADVASALNHSTNAEKHPATTAVRGMFSTIVRVIAEERGITDGQIRGRRRCRKIVEPRQEVYFLGYRLSGMSMPNIAKVMHRDPTTILHGVRAVKSRMRFSADYRDEVEALSAKIEAVSPRPAWWSAPLAAQSIGVFVRGMDAA